MTSVFLHSLPKLPSRKMQSGVTSQETSPLLRCGEERWGGLALVILFKELVNCLPSFKQAFLHFSFSGKLGTCSQNDRLARNNFHVVLICSKSFVGTQLTEAVSGQPWSQQERSPTFNTVRIISIPLTHEPKRRSFGGDSWRRSALVAVGKSHQYPTGPTAVIKYFPSQQWKAIYASKRLFHYYMLTPWHKGRDQNNAVGLSHSSHAFILPTSVDSLIVISVWADMHLTHTEFGSCCSPRKIFSERKRWKTRTHLLDSSIFPLPCSLASINTPEGTGQLIELPCAVTSGNESKHSCKSKRSKNNAKLYISKKLCSGVALLSHWMPYGLKKSPRVPQEAEPLLLPVPDRFNSAPKPEYPFNRTCCLQVERKS